MAANGAEVEGEAQMGPSSPLLVVPHCWQKRQRLCIHRDCSRLVMLFLQSGPA